MATELTKVNLALSIYWRYKNVIDMRSAVDENTYSYEDTLTDGDAVDKAEFVWADSRTVAASATDSIDLVGGMTDAFGNAITVEKVKLILIRNKSTTAGDVLKMERPATDGTPILGADGDYMLIAPTETFLRYSPCAAGLFSVTATTDDQIDIIETGAANSVSYDIIIIGTKT